MKIQPINIYRLAQVFIKYRYFDDEKSPTEAYGVLMEVFETLSAKSKEDLMRYYRILTAIKMPTAESNGDGGQNGE